MISGGDLEDDEVGLQTADWWSSQGQQGPWERAGGVRAKEPTIGSQFDEEP